MVCAGIAVDLIFAGFGWIPQGERPEPAIAHEWNYTTWLNIIVLIVDGVLVYLHFRNRGGGEPAHGDADETHSH